MGAINMLLLKIRSILLEKYKYSRLRLMSNIPKLGPISTMPKIKRKHHCSNPSKKYHRVETTQ